MTEHRPPLDVAGVRRDLVGPGRALRSVEVVDSTGSTSRVDRAVSELMGA